MNISFTTPACLRPEVHNKTFSSFNKYLKNINLKECTLYLNIDPVPKNRCKISDVEVVAKKYFGNVIVRTPTVPGFTNAINWLWSNANTDYIINLEDDWMLFDYVDVKEAIKQFNLNPQLNLIRFRWKLSNKFMYGLSPGICRKTYYKTFAGKLNDKLNPEVQLNSNTFKIDEANVGKNVIGWPQSKIVVRDIGTKWKQDNKIKIVDSKGNPGGSRTFIRWKN